jgi:hypothetical protein
MLEALEDRVLLKVDVVVQWNLNIIDAVRTDLTPPFPAGTGPTQPGPTRVSRVFAIVHAGIYDAVNSFQRAYTPYINYVPVISPTPGFTDDAIVAAACYAGHDTLAKLYPKQTAKFDSELADCISGLDPNQVRIGKPVGIAAAKQINDARTGDGSQIEPGDPGSTIVGRWRPTPPDFRLGLDPNWGSVTPFAIPGVVSFAPPAPPGLLSPEYTAAYLRVYRLGGDGIITPTERTADQTNIARFFSYDAGRFGTPLVLYNQLVQTVTLNFPSSTTTHVEYARLFALANLATVDSSIVTWYAKYFYNFWRPVTGIRLADQTGNPDTPADPNWTPLGYTDTFNGITFDHVTPNFPSYTSGHATFGAATFKTLQNFYGFNEFPSPVAFFSDEVNNPRIYNRFFSVAGLASLSQDNSDSREYLGVHWRFDDENGMQVGMNIADYVFANFLLPVGGGGGSGGSGGDAALLTGFSPLAAELGSPTESGPPFQAPPRSEGSSPERFSTAALPTSSSRAAEAVHVLARFVPGKHSDVSDLDRVFSSPDLFGGLFAGAPE